MNELLQQIKDGKQTIHNGSNKEEIKNLIQLYDEGYIMYKESWQKREDGKPAYYYEIKAI